MSRIAIIYQTGRVKVLNEIIEAQTPDNYWIEGDALERLKDLRRIEIKELKKLENIEEEKVYRTHLSESWLKIIKESLNCHLKPPRCYSREIIKSILFSLEHDIEEVKK